MGEGFPKAAAMEDWAPGVAEAQQLLAELKKKAGYRGAKRMIKIKISGV